MSAVPLVQTLRERQTICTVELLCDNDRENDVAQARAETEPDAGKSVICTVLRAANHCFDSLEKPIMLQGHLYGEIVIEDDVWIAANCTITPGTRIGHGAVVGAGAVVTRDVEPYAIVGGVPARVIGSRRKD